MMGKQDPRADAPGVSDPAGSAPAGAADPAELDRFAAMAATWWDARGPLRPLHVMNPIRVDWLLDRAAERFGRDRAAALPLAGVTVLDVGCGAGLLSEPLTRLGATVTGLDPGPAVVGAARAHARAAGLTVGYEIGTTDDVIAAGRSFDLVTAMEVIEHVPDPHAFVSGLAQLVRPGGLLVLSTLSRTLRSLLLGVVAAELLLRWLPRGTHDWRRFVRPAELANRLRDAGMRPSALTGVVYEPAYDRFRLTRDPGVNYLMAAVRD
jgi:2-polyprenyl-6-hydroxyphenyl methylase/3-demethylubiquinone-9 3-methyltransferase